MRGDVKFEIDGREHRVRLTLGALEELQEDGFAPGVVYNALASGIWEAKELGATLRAGLKVTGSDVTADDVVAALGAREAVRIAFRAMHLFFDPDDAGNVLAAVDGVTETAASTDS